MCNIAIVSEVSGHSCGVEVDLVKVVKHTFLVHSNQLLKQ
jgi:hypothetical protein